MKDSLFEALQHLPSADPDAARALRIRDRCVEELTRGTSGHRPDAPVFWAPLAASLGGLYLLEVLRLAGQVYAAHL
jgi:hypothetical protein